MDITLKNKEEITGTHWIEFNVTDTLHDLKHWSDDSKYLDECAYNLFTDIFEESAIDFNYYGHTKFDNEQLLTLKRGIDQRISTLDKLKTLQDVIDLSKNTTHALDLTQQIREIGKRHGFQEDKFIHDIKSLGENLSRLIDKCIQRDKALIVVGL
jgi:hypothetical protein